MQSAFHKRNSRTANDVAQLRAAYQYWNPQPSLWQRLLAALRG